MGYDSQFEGRFDLNKPLTEAHGAYLKAFSASRRMARNEVTVRALIDTVREAVHLPVGTEGQYYVGNAEKYYPQDRDISILDYNKPPSTQPGLWNRWVPTKDLTGIEWNGAEKFYEYEEWLRYLVEHFLEPWGYVLNGFVSFQGEDRNDYGFVCAVDNVISLQKRKKSTPKLKAAPKAKVSRVAATVAVTEPAPPSKPSAPSLSETDMHAHCLELSKRIEALRAESLFESSFTEVEGDSGVLASSHYIQALASLEMAAHSLKMSAVYAKKK